MKNLKAKLVEIGVLEQKYGVLGVSFYTEKGAKVTTENSAEAVKTLLDTVGAIRDGKRKFTKADFSKME